MKATQTQKAVRPTRVRLFHEGKDMIEVYVKEDGSLAMFAQGGWESAASLNLTYKLYEDQTPVTPHFWRRLEPQDGSEWVREDANSTDTFRCTTCGVEGMAKDLFRFSTCRTNRDPKPAGYNFLH